MTKKSSYIEAHITCTKCVQIFIQYLKLAKKTNLKRKLIKSTFWHRCLIWNARNANVCNRRQCPDGILKRSRLSIAPRVSKERTSERRDERASERTNEWTNDSRLTFKLTGVSLFTPSYMRHEFWLLVFILFFRTCWTLVIASLARRWNRNTVTFFDKFSHRSPKRSKRVRIVNCGWNIRTRLYGN